MQTVTLVCDGKEYEVELEIAQQSVILKNMIEDTGKEGKIPLNNLDIPTFDRILEFCRHYRDAKMSPIEKPLKSSNLADVVDEWYAKFIDLEKMDDIISLVIAANYLDIDPLTELSCAKLASLIKGKTAEEIRKKFGIENDFTPEEEAQIREENKWSESVVN
jgi:S-phase kinase-associated protein 1